MEEKNWIDEMIQREAIPKPARKESTAEFCATWGVSEETYYYHKKKKENKKKIVEIWLSEAADDGNIVLQKLKEKAQAGDTKSIELYLKFILELADNLDIKTDGEKINSVDLDAILSAYAQRNNNKTESPSS